MLIIFSNYIDDQQNDNILIFLYTILFIVKSLLVLNFLFFKRLSINCSANVFFLVYFIKGIAG